MRSVAVACWNCNCGCQESLLWLCLAEQFEMTFVCDLGLVAVAIVDVVVVVMVVVGSHL